MIWACGEEVHGCVSQQVCEIGYSKSQERQRYVKKELGEVIKHDLAQIQFIEDMTLDRKVRKSRIRIEGQQVGECCCTLCGRGKGLVVLFGKFIVPYSSICITIYCCIYFLSGYLVVIFSWPSCFDELSVYQKQSLYFTKVGLRSGYILAFLDSTCEITRGMLLLLDNCGVGVNLCAPRPIRMCTDYLRLIHVPSNLVPPRFIRWMGEINQCFCLLLRSEQ